MALRRAVAGGGARSLPVALAALSCALVPACGGSGAVDGDAGQTADAVIGSPDAGPELPPPLCSISLDCGGAQIPDEPKIPCSLRIDDGAGTVEYDGVAGVEKRGRSSLDFPKPQYAVELRLPDGQENPTNLLGMGQEADWVFNGAYIDRALVRNKLLYELFQRFGGPERYAAEIAYCELTLDGDWRGIYMLTERVKRDDDRIDIALDVAGDGASFILKQDEYGFRELGFAHGSWRTIYPNEDRATAGQIAGISAYLAAWEDAVAGTGGDIFDSVDLDSAVDFVLLQEFAKNNDAFFLSVHVWKDSGGLIYFTPWDLDLSFGQPLYNESYDPHGWIFYRPAMIRAMAAHPLFQARLVERWSELRAGLLSEDALFERLDFHLATIAPRVADNFARWPIDEIQFLDGQLYPVTSFEEEIGLVRAWIAERLLWMDANIAAYGE